MPMKSVATNASNTQRSKTTKGVVPVTEEPAVTVLRPSRLHLPVFRPKHIVYPEKLPSASQLGVRTVQILVRYKWLFLSISVVYAVLNLILVHGFNSWQDVAALKRQSLTGVNGPVAFLYTGFAVFGTMLTSPSTATATAGSSGAYQLFLGLIISLATIWGLRQVLASQQVGLRDVFYKGMYPLVPFVVVVCVALVQIIPFIIGGFIYTLVVTGGVAVGAVEQTLFGILFAVLALVSVYFLCSSLLALYIVTLPDMTPRQALKRAGQLVRYRRGAVLRKMLYLPVVLLVLSAVIMLFFILTLPVIAPLIFFLLPIVGLIIVHAYMYTLYEALLA
jgi:hypothetical protein